MLIVSVFTKNELWSSKIRPGISFYRFKWAEGGVKSRINSIKYIDNILAVNAIIVSEI